MACISHFRRVPLAAAAAGAMSSGSGGILSGSGGSGASMAGSGGSAAAAASRAPLSGNEAMLRVARQRGLFDLKPSDRCPRFLETLKPKPFNSNRELKDDA